MATPTRHVDFNNPGKKWTLAPGARKRNRPELLIVQEGAGKRHLSLRLGIRFSGPESVEFSFEAPIPAAPQDSNNLPNSDELETDHDQSDGVQEEFELDTSKCPLCCSQMDYEVVMECEATCVVCYRENVQCIVSCTTYHNQHGMCKESCYLRYSGKN